MVYPTDLDVQFIANNFRFLTQNFFGRYLDLVQLRTRLGRIFGMSEAKWQHAENPNTVHKACAT